MACRLSSPLPPQQASSTPGGDGRALTSAHQPLTLPERRYRAYLMPQP